MYIADVSPLKDPMRYEAELQLMDEERRRRIERFRFTQDKLLSLGAGLLLKEALIREGISDAQIVTAPGGKPYLKNHRDIFISISHSGEAALCAIAAVPVGCDIQKLKADTPLAVARRAFSEEEQQQLKVMDAWQQQLSFYKLWTGKESYLKMTGEGLKSMPNDFTIELPFGSQIIKDNTVTFLDIPCGESYQAAVCAEGVISSEQLEIIKIGF